MTFSRLLLIVQLTLFCVFALPQPKINNHKNIRNSLSASSTPGFKPLTKFAHESELVYSIHIRGWKNGGPCSASDEECMSMKMLKYVNQYRASKKIKELGSGTLKQLKNAVKHSKAMQARGKIYHQDLPSVDLGCNTWFAGENVAVNHPLLSNKPTDPARMCVDQFINSPPHRANLENSKFETVVMGVTIGDDGYFWCTQTFAQRTNFSSGECIELGLEKGDEADDEAMQLTSDHSFKIKKFEAKFGKNVRGTFKLKCKNSKCKFCLMYKSKQVVCLRVKDGVKIDKAISG